MVLMEIIRQKINKVIEEITLNNEENDVKLKLKENPFIIVYNKDNQVYALDVLLENELAKKLHGKEKFELVVISGDENLEDIKRLMQNMAENCIQKFNTRNDVLSRATLELVIADNYCSIDKIDMLHNIANEVFHNNKGFKLEYTDYLILDLSIPQEAPGVFGEWLKELEKYYKSINCIPFIFTEELLVRREKKYQKAIKTMASLITVNAVSNKNINEDANSQTMWRCAAYIEDDKLWDYVANLFYQFMNKQNQNNIPPEEYIRHIERFLQDDITIEPNAVVEEMKKMPMNLENVLAISTKTKPVQNNKIIKEVYGNNNPVREYIDLNYKNMHISDIEESLWEKFQMEVPGTRSDIEKSLETALISMIKKRKQDIQNFNEELESYQNLKTQLNVYIQEKCIEHLYKSLINVFLSMTKLENSERELIALKALCNKIHTSEFKEALYIIKEKQNMIIDFLKDSEQELCTFLQNHCDSILKELFETAGYWKMETIEENIMEKIIQNFNLCLQEIFMWQKDEAKNNFCSFLDDIWDKKNMLHGQQDFWAIRNDRLKPPIEEHEYIYINKYFFREDINIQTMLNYKFCEAELNTTTYQDTFSIQYINIRDMDNLKTLAQI